MHKDKDLGIAMNRMHSVLHYKEVFKFRIKSIQIAFTKLFCEVIEMLPL